MIYTPRRRLLSPTLSGYMRASTDNPNGWRPQYTRLSGPGLPDWKTVVAVREAQSRQQQQGVAALQQSEMRNLAYYDAVTRGVAQRQTYGLGSLGALSTSTMMQIGSSYVFYFAYGSLSIAPDNNAVATQIATDTNFTNVSVVTVPTSTLFGSNSIAVTFTYSGQGGSLGSVANEMQNLINTFGLVGLGSLTFTGGVNAGGASVAATNPAGSSSIGGSPAGQSGPCSDDSDCSPGLTCQNGTCSTAPFDWSKWFANNWPLVAGGALAGVVLLHGI